MTRVLLVDCLARGKGERKATLDVVGVGPRSISGVLEREGVDVRIYVFEELASNPAVMLDYDVLMVSAMSSDKGCATRTLRYWREYGSGPAIIGGPISEEYSLLLDKGFDLIVVGEGEKVVKALLDAGLRDGVLPSIHELNLIVGLAYKVNDKIVFTGRAPRLTRSELDFFKPSTKRITDYPHYWGLRVYVEVVRGCSNFIRPRMKLANGVKCIDCDLCRQGTLEQRLYCPVNIPPGCGYCSVPALYGPPRSRSINSIYDEVKELVDIGVTRIVLSAPDFLDYGRDWLVEPLPLTNPREPPPNTKAIEKLLNKLWSIPEISSGEVVVMIENIKANLVDEEVARLLGEFLKDTPVHIGCETGSEKHAIDIGRPNTPEECIKAVELLARHGLRPYVYFIHGLPVQTIDTAIDTVNVMEKVFEKGAEKITVYRFTPLPGTAFEGFPPGPPSIKDPASRLIDEKAVELNRDYKKKMLGRKLEVIVVGRKRSDGIAYPVKHGPVVVISGGSIYYGYRVLVEIVDVVSDRLVRGKIKRVLKKVKR